MVFPTPPVSAGGKAVRGAGCPFVGNGAGEYPK